VSLETGVTKIISAHLFPPAMYDYSDDFRRSQFETLASLVGERTIVIGDMNATPFQRVSVGQSLPPRARLDVERRSDRPRIRDVGRRLGEPSARPGHQLRPSPHHPGD
jgi:hypothetical protein